MSFISTKLDQVRLADLAKDPLWSPRRIDLPAAVAAHAALRAALPARSTNGTLYAEFRSETLGFTVRIGYEWDGPAYHAAEFGVERASRRTRWKGSAQGSVGGGRGRQVDAPGALPIGDFPLDTLHIGGDRISALLASQDGFEDRAHRFLLPVVLAG